jgi:hypothetical protein
MRFKRDDENKLGYRKHKKYHDFNLQQFIIVLLRDAKDDLDKQEHEGSESEGESSYKSGDSGDESGTEAKAKPMDFKDPTIGLTDHDLVGPQLMDYTPDLEHRVEVEEANEFLNETVGMIKTGDVKEDTLRNDIEDTIMGIFGDGSKKKKKKRKDIYIGVQEEDITPEQEAERQKTHEKYMEKYNDEFRGKSLLEIHELKKLNKRDKKGNRKDRYIEKDLGGHTSKDAFKAMHQNNYVNDKFDSANSRFL